MADFVRDGVLVAGGIVACLVSKDNGSTRHDATLIAGLGGIAILVHPPSAQMVIRFGSATCCAVALWRHWKAQRDAHGEDALSSVDFSHELGPTTVSHPSFRSVAGNQPVEDASVKTAPSIVIHRGKRQVHIVEAETQTMDAESVTPTSFGQCPSMLSAEFRYEMVEASSQTDTAETRTPVSAPRRNPSSDVLAESPLSSFDQLGKPPRPAHKKTMVPRMMNLPELDLEVSIRESPVDVNAKSGSGLGESSPFNGSQFSPASSTRNLERRSRRLSQVEKASTVPAMRRTVNWRKGALLGSGANGVVHMGLNLDTGEMMAVKTMDFCAEDPKLEERLSQLANEISILKDLDHEFTVKYFFTERVGAAMNIFMEYVPGGSIASILKTFGPLSEIVVAQYTSQVLAGLAYLHSSGTVHRDIKGANLLLTVNGSLKIADFGSAAKHTADGNVLTGMHGTPVWMAPEVIRGEGHGWPADIWSLGCTVMEMLTAKPPWSHVSSNPMKTLRMISNDTEPLELPSGLSGATEEFLRACLQRNPRDRMSALGLLEHLFFEMGEEEEEEVQVALTVSEPEGNQENTPERSGPSVSPQHTFLRDMGHRERSPLHSPSGFSDDEAVPITNVESITFDAQHVRSPDRTPREAALPAHNTVSPKETPFGSVDDSSAPLSTAQSCFTFGSGSADRFASFRFKSKGGRKIDMAEESKMQQRILTFVQKKVAGDTDHTRGMDGPALVADIREAPSLPRSQSARSLPRRRSEVCALSDNSLAGSEGSPKRASSNLADAIKLMKMTQQQQQQQQQQQLGNSTNP